MKDIGKWALDNSKLVYFLIVVLLIGGAKSFYDMSKLEDPEIRVKQALIVTVYPGASAHQVELEVSDILEKSIRTMKNLEYVESKSMNDVSMISVNLSTLVKNDDVEQHWDLLRRKVADVQAGLPEGAGESVVMDDFGDVYGMFYALTADGFSDRELNDYAGLVKREIQSIEGITRVNIYGEHKNCIEIELYEDRMANLGILPAEVLSTLNGQNKTVYSGYYETGDNRLRVTVNDKYRNVEDIGNLILQGHEDDQLRLKDIARVSEQTEEPVLNEMRYDKKRALGIAIAAERGTDVTKLGKQVEAVFSELKTNRFPAGIEYHKVFFQPERVEEAINTFMVNLIESLIIVIFILMLTMGFKSGIIIGCSLVVVVIGSFFILNLFDGTLQRVSLAAFVLAMGMLVDNAIVIIDGILVDLKRGKERTEALTAIGRKTGMPLLAATLIAILAFFPIFLSPDTAGIYVRDLFIVLAVSLLLSWVLALTQVPIQAAYMLKIKPQNESEPLFDNKYYRLLRQVLYWGLRHKAITIAAAVFLLLVSVYCYRFLPQGFFPDMDYNQLYIEYKLPEGTNSTKVKADLSEIEDYLFSRKEVTHVTSSIGGTPARYNLVRSMADPSLSYGELIVDFTSSKELVANMQDIQMDLSQTYPDAYVRLKRYNLMYKKYPIELQFNGPDPAVLRDLTAQAEDMMRKSPDIILINSDWEPKTPVLSVDYNQPVARNIGLSRQDVGLSLLAATGGIPTGVFYEGNRSQTIYVKCVDKDGKPIESLENSPVFGMTLPLNKMDKKTIQGLMAGLISEEELLESVLGTVPLSQATHGVKVVWEDPAVIRYNGQRAMRAQGNPAFGVTTEDARQSIIKEVEKIRIPEGYSYQWEGEYRASSTAMKYLFKHLPLGVILMITILILLFKDYRKPIIIFCCIPLIMIGVIIAMLITGKTFGFVAIVGTLGLMGMMIKNGIVLMDEIAMQISQGVEPVKALLDSTSARFRPVMMASMTTIVGMFPLVTDDLFGAGAVAIMGGLLLGTLITLFIIPVLYAIFFKIRIK
ncbi:MAG: efflux RND transporter permease subunit [Candidatus Symbiothrix sp.]|jgi:multidrug efflux pump subunit AcrB|nr:efflux RND transporter permease subunit [Candidatus Symbiothrix sp.]